MGAFGEISTTSRPFSIHRRITRPFAHATLSPSFGREQKVRLQIRTEGVCGILSVKKVVVGNIPPSPPVYNMACPPGNTLRCPRSSPTEACADYALRIAHFSEIYSARGGHKNRLESVSLEKHIRGTHKKNTCSPRTQNQAKGVPMGKKARTK